MKPIAGSLNISIKLISLKFIRLGLPPVLMLNVPDFRIHSGLNELAQLLPACTQIDQEVEKKVKLTTSRMRHIER